MSSVIVLASSVTTSTLDQKIEETAAGLPASYVKMLRMISEENTSTIIDYIAAVRVEVNLSDNYRRDLIEVLSRFARYAGNKKSFKDITRNEIISFIESFRKTDAADPLHKWIGTYNIY